jgi:hypothetical protein
MMVETLDIDVEGIHDFVLDLLGTCFSLIHRTDKWWSMQQIFMITCITQISISDLYMYVLVHIDLGISGRFL